MGKHYQHNTVCKPPNVLDGPLIATIANSDRDDAKLFSAHACRNAADVIGIPPRVGRHRRGDDVLLALGNNFSAVIANRTYSQDQPEKSFSN